MSLQIFPLLRLPQELLVHTLQFCTHVELLQFSVTCRRYLHLVQNVAILQLKIELGANRLQLSRSTAKVGRQELLESLMRYQDNWLDLNLTRGPTIIRAPDNEKFTLWDLSGGLFANAYSTKGFRPLQADALQLIPLDEPDLRWNLTFDVTFHELAIDPAQDLVILATVNETAARSLSLRFSTLKAGVAHPLAKHPIVSLLLQFTINPDPTYSTVTLLIANGLVVLNLVSSHEDRPYTDLQCDVLVINWHTGILLHRMGCLPGFCTSVFLDTERLAVFFAGGYVENSAGSITLFIYDKIRIPRATDSYLIRGMCDVGLCSQLGPALVLSFPEYEEFVGIMVHDFLVRSEPISSDSPFCSHKFVPDPLSRTLCLTIRFLGDLNHERYVVFIDVQKILSHLAYGSFVEKSWSEWGEQATRWLSLPGSPSNWTSCIRGSRFLMAMHIEGLHRQLVLADFNTTLVRRLKSRIHNEHTLTYLAHESDILPDELWPWPYINTDPAEQQQAERKMAQAIVGEDAPTIIRHQSENEIFSRLPYRLHVVAEPSLSYDDWMVDGNRLIGIKVNQHNIAYQFVVYYVQDR